MARVNENYLKLTAGYLFPEIGRRVKVFADANPGASIIRLGIGDVTLPLAPAVVAAMRKAIDEMGTEEGFRGYGPGNGYAAAKGSPMNGHAPAAKGIRTRRPR